MTRGFESHEPVDICRAVDRKGHDSEHSGVQMGA
jgi:hypothetical protein